MRQPGRLHFGPPNQITLMAGGPETGATFQALNASGTAVDSGSIGTKLTHAWNSAYSDEYPLGFSVLSLSDRSCASACRWSHNYRNRGHQGEPCLGLNR
jgi:hypothetical protein